VALSGRAERFLFTGMNSFIHRVVEAVTVDLGNGRGNFSLKSAKYRRKHCRDKGHPQL